MNAIWLAMSVGSVVLAVLSPVWWGSLIALVCAFKYFTMAMDD